MSARTKSQPITRRRFLQAGAVGAAGLMTSSAWGQSAPAGQPAAGNGGNQSGTKPNIVFISADQLGIEALSGHGCPYVRTPNIDRLLNRGTSFRQCYTANPLCSPARSTWFTGRMASETGVTYNSRAILPGMQTLGPLIKDGGYETYFSGKMAPAQWITPKTFPATAWLPGGMRLPRRRRRHRRLPIMRGVFAARRSPDPFLLVAPLLQPHDICYWIFQHMKSVSDLPYGLTESQLPQLPPNFTFDPREPKAIYNGLNRPKAWTPLHWRYYLWSYYRHVEMVDAEIGRILDALDDSPHIDNTVIIFAADHGEGQGRHQTVMKNFLYDEASRVPLIVSWPGRVPQGVQDNTHLTSSSDIRPTICDYAGVTPSALVVGKCLRPLLEGKTTTWRDMVASEVVGIGRMIRTDQYKYITYKGDPVEQLFDIKSDPWETKNIAGEAHFASALDDHRKLLTEWTGRLEVAPVRI